MFVCREAAGVSFTSPDRASKEKDSTASSNFVLQNAQKTQGLTEACQSNT